MHNNGYHNYMNISNNRVEYCMVATVLMCMRNSRADLYEGLLGWMLTTLVSYGREYRPVYSQTCLSFLTEAA